MLSEILIQIGRPSVRLSVCLSVTRRYSVETAKHVIERFHC